MNNPFMPFGYNQSQSRPSSELTLPHNGVDGPQPEKDIDSHAPCALCGHQWISHGDRAIIHCGQRDMKASAQRPDGVKLVQWCKCENYREEK